MAVDISTQDVAMLDAGDFTVEGGFLEFAKDDSSDVLHLTEKEKELLRLYDESEDLRVQTAILKASNKLSKAPSKPPENLEGALKEAQQELLNARTLYTLRNRITEGVLTTDPTLKAVHSGQNATLAERELLPRITRRDILSMAHTNLSASLSSTINSVASAEVQNMQVMRKNREMTKELLSLAADVEPFKKDNVKDPKLKADIEYLEDEVKTQRLRWRIIKSVVSAIIAGSGVDWAHDEELRELVMDPEDDAFD